MSLPGYLCSHFWCLWSHSVLQVHHDDVIKWKHFSALLVICTGNSLVTSEFPTQKPVARSFDVFFDLLLNGEVNSREAGDLRRHRAHYDCNDYGQSDSQCEMKRTPGSYYSLNRMYRACRLSTGIIPLMVTLDIYWSPIGASRNIQGYLTGMPDMLSSRLKFYGSS